ncbi:MAG: type 1 glutamine amidotransferase [Granulosicoccus sp.]|nr:type 1 glutamine amidotransferase [Granulosicoccus sp.]
MKIGILQCGRAPEEIRDKHGDYDAQFEQLLAHDDLSFQTWAVLDNELPSSIDDADGWLITGSKFGVYEDHPWIPPLEKFLRDAYAKKIPIVGICFGHQILAQALGGKVIKFPGGWSVGHVDYTLQDNTQVGVIAFHQDQVVELPEGATVTGSTDFCEYAFISYGNQALSMQPHPEFDEAFLQDLLAVRSSTLPESIVQRAQDRTGQPLARQRMADSIVSFFLLDRSTE